MDFRAGADDGPVRCRATVNQAAIAWWQPRPQVDARGASLKGLPHRFTVSGVQRAALEGSPAAFYALVTFTFVLLLSPQAWFPVLKLIRIAFLAGGIAMAAHVMERTAHKQPITPLAPEIGI